MTSIAAAVADLKVAFSRYYIVSTKEGDLVRHSKGLCLQYRSKHFYQSSDDPDPWLGSPYSVVVHVLSTEDVVKTLNISRKHSVPIVVRRRRRTVRGNLF
jgi:D-lactate dehydrogenase (cytochrome)